MNSARDLPLVRVLVTDDHGIVREGLTVVLESGAGIKVVGAAASGGEAILAAQRLKPDVVIMDLVLPDMTGIDATQRILELLPRTHIIAVSACHTTEHIRRALRAGARGYVAKAATGGELLQAVHTVMSGRQFLSPGITPLVIEELLLDSASKSPMERLSLREREVLHRIVAGSTSADIAAHLSLSRKTVDTYRGRLMVKLGVGSRSALIRYALEHELMAL